MNSFFEYIQPTIIRTSYDESFPENICGRFFANVNIFGIKHYNDLTDIIDIPRLYFLINDKFINNADKLFDFICDAIVDNSLFITGNDDFIYGEDYYMNNTLFDYLDINGVIGDNDLIVLPDYISINGFNEQYWIDLSNENYKNYIDFKYFSNKNKLLDNTFSEEDLKNFYSTFCKIILDNTLITNETKNTGNNQIYDLVLNYYANFKTDISSTAIQLILGSLYASTTQNVTNCGCNSSVSESTYSSLNCHDMYLVGMTKWIKTMFGDKKFYEDWFFIQLNDNELIPNNVLIDALELFINEFLDLYNNFSLTSKSTTIYKCGCPDIQTSGTDCNKTILLNFLTILEYIKSNELDKNKNKIKIYGEQFGEVLPNLQF